MGTYVILLYGVFIGLIILNYFIAKKLNTNHRTQYPDHQDYKWGYFQGVGLILFGGLYALIYTIIDIISETFTIVNFIIYIGLLFISVSIGYFACKKSKQAMIWVTVLTLNPIIWIINYFYIKNRRGEFFEKGNGGVIRTLEDGSVKSTSNVDKTNIGEDKIMWDFKLKKTRIAIVISLIYEFVVFFILDANRNSDEPILWIIFSIPVIAYWLYKFVKAGE